MPRFARSFLLTLALLIGGWVLSYSTVLAAPQINNQINYQARLMDASGYPVADGNYSVIFSLYDAASAGTRLWTATGTLVTPTALTVNVQNGLFTVLLGDTASTGGSQNTLDTVDWNSDQLYLGVTINGDSEMTPRKRFASAPQAFNARQLQGMYASSTASGGQTLFTLNQTENSAAASTRSALDVRSMGTSNANDFLIRGINDLGSTVFSVNRQGNATTSRDLMVVGSATTSNLFVSGTASTSALYVSGQSVCLADGTNCLSGSGTDLNWTYNLAGDFVRNATSTTDVIIGNTTVATAPFRFDTNTTSSRLIIGQTSAGQTRADLVIGATTSSGMNSAFQLTGQDLFVQGNIGSASSVYTNGAFVAGPGSTMYGDGFITKNDGNLTLSANEGIVASSRLDALYLNRWFLSPLLNNTIYGAANATTTVGTNPYSVAFDGSHIWVTNYISNYVSKIDITTNAVVATTAVGSGPLGVAFDGSYIWVANSTSGNISKIDITTNAVVATTTVGTNPDGVAFDGSYIWVANYGSGNVSKINITTNAVVATVAVGTSPQGVAFDGSHIWVANQSTNNVSKIDITTNAVVATTTVGTQPRGVAFDGSHIWVTNRISNNVSKIDIMTNTVVATTTVGTNPYSVAFDGSHVWVTNEGSNTVSKIDIMTNAVVATTTVGTNPAGIAFDGSHVWVANNGSGNMTKLPIGGGSGTNENYHVNLVPDTNNAFDIGSPALSWGNIYASGTVGVGTDVVVNGQSVCLENGTNCQPVSGTDLNWTFDLAGDFVRNATSTTDVIIGNTTVATAPFRFDTNTTSSRLIIGQTSAGQTRADVVIGATTSSGMNAAFQLTGDDLFVAGNIGSASSVYTNGAFVAGPGSTMYGDGFITKTNGDLALSASGLFTVASTTDFLGNVGVGTATPITQLDVVGRVPTTFVGSTTTGGNPVSVYVQGRYAYVVNMSASTLQIFDVSNPATPVGVGSVATGFTPTSVYVQGQYAYVTNGNSNTLQIFDVSNPSAPVSVGSAATGLYPNSVYVQGRYAYVVNGTANTLEIIDVADVSAPVSVGSVAAGTNPWQVSVQGRYAFVVSFVGGLKVFDISNPIAPVSVGSVAAGTNPKSIYVQGRYAYVLNYNSDTLQIFDISNPTAPVIVGSAATGGSPKSIYVQGRYAYILNTSSGTLQFFDISNPSLPVSKGTVFTGFTPYAVHVQGRYAYVTVININQLEVFDLGGAYIQQLEVGGIETGTLSVRNNLSGVDASFLGGLTVGQSTNISGALSVGGTIVSGGVGVCLANGTNCGADLNWTYDLAGDFVRNATSTTDVIIGNTTVATAPFRFDTNTTSSRLIIGQTSAGQTRADLVIGATTSSGMNTLFQLTGDDLFVAGNIGSASSVYTNGAFVAGPGSTYFGDGYITKTNGDLALSTSGSFTVASTTKFMGNVAYGTTTPITQLHVQGKLPTSAIGSVATGLISPQQVFVQGRYAYVVSFSASTLRIFDVSNPATPVSVGSVFANGPRGVYVQGIYAYVANTAGNSLQIFDVSKPSAPVSVGTVATGAAPRSVYVQGRYAYIVSNTASTLEVIDVSSPTAPVNVGTVATNAAPMSVYVQGRYAYVTSYNINTLQVIDISTPSTPTVVGVVTTGTNPWHVFVQGRYAYVANFSSNTLQVIDISNPTAPSIISTFTTNTGPMAVYVQGRYAYITSNTLNTLQVIDVSTPSAPVSLGTVGTGSNPSSVSVQGRYAFVVNSVSDNMQIFDLGGAYVQQLEAGGIETGTLSVRNNLFGVDASFLGGLTVGQSTNISGNLSVGGTIVSGGVGVCLANGTNCGADLNWTYDLAGDFVTNATSTTDVIIGNTTVATAPFRFDTTTTSSRFIIGQSSADQTRADLVIGATTSSISNAAFQLTGQDLFVQGNIGSASSVYTNGAFVAGPGSTHFGDGFITKNDGDLTLSASGALVVASTSTFLGNISFGTSTPIAQLYVPGKVPISVAGSASAGTSPDALFVQGRYSYVTDFSTKELHILDTSIPSAPVSLGAISTSWIPLDVYVQGQYAYVVTLDPSLRIFDISNPSAPSAVGSITTPGSNPAKVYVQGRYAYVLEQANKTLIIYDISNPVTPVLVGSVGTSASTPEAIAVQGHYAYVITSASSNLLVIDVSNPSAPSVVGPAALLSTPSDISVQGQYAYIVSSSGSTIESFNITNPASPTSVTTTSLVVNPTSIFVQDRYAYVTKFQNLEVVDIADPAAMTSVGVLTMASTPMSVVVEGRYAYSLVNGSSLLQTYDLGGAYIQQLEVGGMETGTLSVRNNMQALDGSFLGGLSVAQSSNFSGGLSVVASSTSSTATFVNRSSPSSGMAWGAYIDQLSVGSNASATGTANYSMVITYASTSNPAFAGLCIDDTTTGPTCPTSSGGLGASLVADGAVVSDGFDIAEMYSVTGTAEAGDVLVLDASSTATVRQSTGVAYDSKVIGIVSTDPGFLLGWSGDTKVALAGRVPVKVSMNNGPIQVGDALVSSDVPGYAMKATRPGMVLGYALEDSSATGTAEAFVNVGYWAGIVFDENGAVAVDDAGNVRVAHDLHVGGKFFPSLKGGGLQDQWYLFVNADDASTTYMSTNADGWMSMDTYDFAERYYSPDELDAGDLVVVSDSGQTHVQRAMNEDKMLLGIVSTRPAFIAGRPATSTYPIALSGRVPTKVSNINGAIKAGDPLAPTTIPGVAAKAIHTGPIVGLALEDFESAEIGKIEVFVNPGYWVNKSEVATPASVATPEVSSQIVVSQGKQGFATIVAGSKKVRIEFPSLNAYPNVQVTPRGSIQSGWWTENYSDTGFEIILAVTEDHDVVFAWRVDATTAQDVMRMSDGTYATVDPVTGMPTGWVTTTTEAVVPEPAPEPILEPVSVTTTDSVSLPIDASATTTTVIDSSSTIML